MKLKYILASFVAAATLMVGCTVEEPVSQLSGLEVSNDYVTVSADAQSSATITVTADEAWSATASDSWFSISPSNGSAGQSSLTITASEASSARSGEVHIKMGSKTKIISFNQSAPAGVEVPPSTCAEVIAGENITYKVVGTVTKIANDQYGNWYLADDTGEIYIYGTFNSKGAYPKDADGGWAGFGIEVGDQVMVEGPKTVYNGVVELVDVSYKIVQKSLIDASLTTETLTPAAGKDTLLVSSKVQPVLVSVDADWIKVSDLTSDGNYLLVYEENVRTADRTATITIKAPGAVKALTIKQEGVPATGMTVTEIIAAADDDMVQTLPSTVVVALTTRGAVVSDGQNALYAYGNSAAALKIGDGVKISAKKTTYNGVPELTDISDVFVDSEGNTVSYPDAKDITAKVVEYTSSVAEYIKYSGTLKVSGNYYNLEFDGLDPATLQGSINYPIDALGAKDFNGKKITVTGYYNGSNTNKEGIKFVNIIATKIAEFVDNPKGTLKNPYEATELAELLKSGTVPEGNVYARGIINKIDNVNTQYGNAQYWLSTDGSAADLEVYRGFYYGGEKFTEETAEAIKVGDEVVVFGKVKVFGETPEFDANNYLVTINGKAAPSGSGTAEDPYNITKLVDLLLSGETIEGEVYAKGIISQIDNVNLQFGNAQYWLSDDGGKKYQLEVYRGFWFGGEKFTSEDQIALGDEVVVFGKVKVYKDTPEFDANNKIISLNGKTE
ncbi:MAG: BACON domain-containing protein [Bacteroidales bacterium]|nr:BACON domain-containing protein [Bacteroidales bacterium]